MPPTLIPICLQEGVIPGPILLFKAGALFSTGHGAKSVLGFLCRVGQPQEYIETLPILACVRMFAVARGSVGTA